MQENQIPGYWQGDTGEISGVPWYENRGLYKSMVGGHEPQYNYSYPQGPDAPPSIDEQYHPPAQPYELKPAGSYPTPGSAEYWWDKNTSGQLGVDNAFRLGSLGLAGLGVAGNLGQQQQQRKSFGSALNYLQSNQDPNADYYRSEIRRMVEQPSGYLTDVNTQNKLATARESMLRANRLKGINSLSPEQTRQLQDLAAGVHQQRLKTLMDLVGRDNTMRAAGAELMTRAPSNTPLQAIVPGLGSMFNTAKEYAVSQGYASDPSLRASGDYLAGRSNLQAGYGDKYPNIVKRN
jgi:hypothetical protein